MQGATSFPKPLVITPQGVKIAQILPRIDECIIDRDEGEVAVKYR